MLLLATDRTVYRADLDPVHVVVARPGAAGDVVTVPLFRGPVTVERRAVALDAHGFGELTLGPLPAGRYTLGGWSRAPGASFEVHPADPLGLDDDGPLPAPPRLEARETVSSPGPDKVDVYFKVRDGELHVDLILPPGRTGTALVVARRVRAGAPGDWGARLHAARAAGTDEDGDPAAALAARPPLSAIDDVPPGTAADHPHVARELDSLLEAAVRSHHRALEIHLETEHLLVRATGGPDEMIVNVERPRLGRLLVERLRALSADGTLAGRRRVRFEHVLAGEPWQVDMETDPDPGWRGVRLELSHADDRARAAAEAVSDDPAVAAWRAAGVPPGAPLHFGKHRVPNRVKVPLPAGPGEVEVAVFALTAGLWTCATHRAGAPPAPRPPALAWRVLAPGEELTAEQAGGRSLTVLASPMEPYIETAEALACLEGNSPDDLTARYHGTAALLELAGPSARRTHLERLLAGLEPPRPRAPVTPSPDLAAPPSPSLLAALRTLADAGTVTVRDPRVRARADGQLRPVLHLTDQELTRVAAVDHPLLIRVNR